MNTINLVNPFQEKLLVTSFKKPLDMDDFNTDGCYELQQMSQPLTCNLIAKSRPLLNEIISFKEEDVDDFNTASYNETLQISQPLPCNVVAKSRPLLNEIKSFKKIVIDDLNTDSYSPQISQPLPCNLIAKSRPSLNKMKSFKKTTCSSTTEDSILNISESRYPALTSFCNDSNKNLLNLSHKSQYRTPLVEVDINSSTAENCQSCPKPFSKTENNSTLFISQPLESPNISSKKVNSKRKPSKLRPFPTDLTKENVNVAASLEMGETVCRSPKISYSPARKRFKFSQNKINDISKNKKSRLFDVQNEPSFCIKTKESNADCLSISGQYSSKNKNMSDLNSSQPLSSILTDKKLSFETPISGEKAAVNHKQSFEPASSLTFNECDHRSSTIFPEQRRPLSESLVIETRESKKSKEPLLSPILGRMRVHMNTERPILEQMDTSDCLSPVLDKMCSQFSLQTVQQNFTLQNRKPKPNILCNFRSDNKALLTAGNYETENFSTNLCRSTIEKKCPKKSRKNLAHKTKNKMDCIQKPISPILSQKLQKEQLSPVLDLSQCRKSFAFYNEKVRLMKNSSQQNESSSSNNMDSFPLVRSGSYKGQKSLDSSQTIKDPKSGSKIKYSKKTALFEHPQVKNSATQQISPVLDSRQYKNLLTNLPTVKFYKNNEQCLTSKPSISWDQSPVVVSHDISEGHQKKNTVIKKTFKTISQTFSSSPHFKRQNSLATPKNKSNHSCLMLSTYFQKNLNDLNFESTNQPSGPMFGLKSTHHVLQDVFLGRTLSDETGFGNIHNISFSPNTILDQENNMSMTLTSNTEYDVKHTPLSLSQICGEFITDITHSNFINIISPLNTSFKENYIIPLAPEQLSNSKNVSLSSSIKSSIPNQFSEKSENREALHCLSQDKLLQSQMSSDILKEQPQDEELFLDSKSTKKLSVQMISRFHDGYRTDDKAATSEIHKYIQSSSQKINFNKNINTMKKTVKKKLSLSYESPDKNPSLLVNTFSETVQELTYKASKLTANKEDSDVIIISGVERLANQTPEKSDLEKVRRVKFY